MVELKEKCREVINSNFSVVMETEDYLNLDVKQVMEWVSSDDVIVNAEEDIFQGIVKWVSHDKSEREKDFPELLHQIRLSSISHDFLLNTLVKEELITENPVFCLNFVVNAMKSSLLSSSDRESSQLPRKCQETHNDGIFVVGGRYCVTFLRKICGMEWREHCLSLKIPLLPGTKVKFIFLIQRYTRWASHR